jgi:hypothetical protein
MKNYNFVSFYMGVKLGLTLQEDGYKIKKKVFFMFSDPVCALPQFSDPVCVLSLIITTSFCFQQAGSVFFFTNTSCIIGWTLTFAHC